MSLKKAQKMSVLMATITLLILFAGCGGSDNQNTGDVGIDKSMTVTVGTDPQGTGTFGVTAGMAKVLNDNGFNFKVKPTTGATEIAPLLAFGEIELGTMQNFETKHAWLTDMHYEEPMAELNVAPIRILMGGPATYVSPVTTGDSGITTGADVRGKRFVGIYTGSASGRWMSSAALINWGLTEDDVIMIEVPGWGDAIQALIDGRADVAGASTPAQAILKELEAKRGALFLDLDHSPDAIRRYQERFPAAPAIVNPAPEYSGIPHPVHMIAFEDFLLANNSRINDDFAYEIVKTIYENFETFKAQHGNMKNMTVEDMVSDGASAPYHPGAIRYYKEVGLWTDAAEALNQELLDREAALLN